MTNFPWLTVIGLIPLVGAAVVAGLPAGLTDRAKHVALGFSLVTLVFGIAAALQFENGSGQQFQLTEQHEWIPQFGVSYALGVDGIALVMILMALVLTPDLHPGRVERRARGRQAREELLRADARAGHLHGRRLRRHRRVPVLRLLRGDAHPGLLPDRLLRRARAGSMPR